MDLENIDVSRRQLLGAVGLAVVGAGGWTGMQVFTPPSGSDPDYPEDDLEDAGWVERGEQDRTVLERSVGPIEVEAVSSTIQYEKRALRQQLQSRPVTITGDEARVTRELGQNVGQAFDAPLALFSASALDIGPDVDNLPFGLGRAQIGERISTQIREKLVSELENTGLDDIEHEDTDELEVDTGETATLYEYSGVYQVSELSVDFGGDAVTTDPFEIEVATYIAIWHHGDFFFIGGGGHPAEAGELEVPGQLDSGESVTVEMNLGFQPDERRDEILGYIEEIE